MLARVLCFAAVIVAFAPPVSAAERVVTVVGEASLSLTPDSAVLHVGVSTQGKTAREASDANAKQMTAVLAALKTAGFAERDLRTSRLSLQPQYDTQSRPARLTGFQAGNQLAVTVRDVTQVGSVLDRAMSAGANEMSGIEFVVSEQSKLLDKVRAEAMADAARKAELYAGAAGAKLGRVISIAEENAGLPPGPYPMGMKIAGAATPVAPGEQTLRLAVTVSYELTP